MRTNTSRDRSCRRLAGFDPDADGGLIVKSARHSLDGQGYRMNLDLISADERETPDAAE